MRASLGYSLFVFYPDNTALCVFALSPNLHTYCPGVLYNEGSQKAVLWLGGHQQVGMKSPRRIRQFAKFQEDLLPPQLA